MRMKYYLRGMGVGIVVTVLIFMIALIFYNPEISDAEIIRRAKLLGMVDAGESATVADDINSLEYDFDTDDEAAAAATDTTDDDGAAVADTDSETDTALATGDSNAANEDTADTAGAAAQPDSSDTASSSSDNSDNTVIVTSEHPASETAAIAGTITVRSGDSSESVSKKLYQAGVVGSESEFNSFLVSKHYDRILQNGTYDIPENASYEEIAKIITKKQ